MPWARITRLPVPADRATGRWSKGLTGLRRLFFPQEPRTFSGKRWVDIGLRCAHLVGVAGVGGGFLLTLGQDQWLTFWHLTLVSGVLLSLLYLWSSAAWLLQVKGLAIIFKLVLLALALGEPTWRGTLLIAIIVLSGLIAHAPGRIRGLRWCGTSPLPPRRGRLPRVTRDALLANPLPEVAMTELEHDTLRQAVRERYGRVAESDDPGCGCEPTACCEAPAVSLEGLSQAMGYSAAEVLAVPQGANLGLGCGNPQAIAGLKAGETVLDLGSGAGFDAFLAARQVGETGRVIGVDMTPAMVSKARTNAHTGGYRNAEFRLGEIEHLPVADGTVDVIISNCVINLSPDKAQVFADAWRVLKPGGRLAISDVVASAELPEAIRQDLALYTGCMAGASPVSELEAMLREIGFVEVRIAPKGESRSFIRDWAPGTRIEDFLVSATIEAVKAEG